MDSYPLLINLSSVIVVTRIGLWATAHPPRKVIMQEKNNATIIQGLLSLEDKEDHIFMHLIESAKFNKGKEKLTTS